MQTLCEGLRKAMRHHHRIHGTGTGAAHAIEHQTPVFKQGVKHTPGECAMRAAALKGQIYAAPISSRFASTGRCRTSRCQLDCPMASTRCMATMPRTMR